MRDDDLPHQLAGLATHRAARRWQTLFDQYKRDYFSGRLPPYRITLRRSAGPENPSLSVEKAATGAAP